jgi:uncharacterized membrane protein YccC
VDPAVPAPEPAPAEPSGGLRSWIEQRDPGLRATKRSVKAAVLVPGVLAVTEFGTSNPQTPLFAVFGAVALLLFADFGGPRRTRSRSLVGLWVVGAVFITLGTVSSTHAALAVVAMAVAAFLVLFAGVVSPAAAAGSTAALLTFVLPVAVPAAASAVGDRLLGWAVAGVVCIPAAVFLWPGRWHDGLRHTMATAATAVADLLEVGAGQGTTAAARSGVEAALRTLREQYEATPYRPTGAGPTDVALTNLVSRLEWVGGRALAATAAPPPASEAAGVRAVESAAVEVLRLVAGALHGSDGAARPPEQEVADLATAVDRLITARVAATDSALAALVAPEGPGGDPATVPVRPPSALVDVDPTYPTRMLAFSLEMLADVAIAALGGDGAGLRGPGRWSATARSFARVASGHLTLGSVWMRNSIRGAVALGLAVLVTEVTDVQHGFWVVLGTLSVLRSNALGTGSTALRAVLGTAIGFGVGALVLVVLGTEGDGLWALLPFAVLVAGIAPTTISFTAGQAGFTVFVVLVFNIIDPVGSKVGLIRFEDVVIGTAVSVVVGLLFWPRGASAQLARSLGDAYATATAWLVVAVDRVGRTAADADADADGTGWRPERVAAMSASRRLDDAYRQFLGERGAKRVPLPVVTRLLTGSARIRLTAVTLEGLPDLTTPDGPPPLPEVVAARAVVTDECASVESWFEECADSIGGRHPRIPTAPVLPDRPAPQVAVAWSAVRGAGRRDGVFAVLRLLWVEERLDDLVRLQSDLAGTVGSLGRAGGRRTATGSPDDGRV